MHGGVPGRRCHEKHAAVEGRCFERGGRGGVNFRRRHCRARTTAAWAPDASAGATARGSNGSNAGSGDAGGNGGKLRVGVAAASASRGVPAWCACAVAFPAVFVAGRQRLLVPVAAVGFVVCIPLGLGLRSAFGLAGIAIAIGLSTLVIAGGLPWMLWPRTLGAAREAALYSRAVANHLSIQAIIEAKKHGMVFTHISDQERAKLRDMAIPGYRKWAVNDYGLKATLIDSVRNEVNRIYKQNGAHLMKQYAQ